MATAREGVMEDNKVLEEENRALRKEVRRLRVLLGELPDDSECHSEEVTPGCAQPG